MTPIKAEWTEVSNENRCPACNRADWCRLSADGASICRRGGADGYQEIQDRNGANFWIRFPNTSKAGQVEYVVESGPKPASADRLDRAYSELLSRLTLSDSHKKKMLARGFTSDEIAGLGVKTLDQFARSQAVQLAELFPWWQEVPGLALKDDRPILCGWPGMLIPCRDVQGRIVGLRVRSYSDEVPKAPKYSWVSSKRKGSPSPGSPLSYWPGQPGNVARVTEGELKAAMAALRTGIPTICAPGIGLFGSKQIIDLLLELGMLSVLMAPDADFRTNPDVYRHLRTSLVRLKPASFELSVEVWDQSTKGIDDAIQAGIPISTITPEEFFAMNPPSGPSVPFSEGGDTEWKEPEPLQWLPPVPKFPLAVLPPKCRNFANQHSKDLKTPTDFQAAGLLAASSIPIQKKVTVSPWSSWEESVNILGAINGEPSELKSPCLKALIKYHQAEERRLEFIVQEENRKIRGQRKLIENEIREARKEGNTEQMLALADKLEDLQPKPIPELILDDATEEARALSMFQNGGCISVCSTEGSLFSSLGRYSNGEIYCDTITKGSCGDRIKIRRMGRDTISFDGYLSTVIFMQPDILMNLKRKDELKGIGFFARWFWVVPDSLVGTRDYDAQHVCPRSVLSDWEDVCRRMFALGQSADDIVLTLQPAAVNRLRTWMVQMEPRLVSDLAFMKDWAGKLRGLILRFAAVLHCLDHCEAKGEELACSITLETFERAVTLGDYALAHARRAYHLLGYSAKASISSPAMVLLERLRKLDQSSITVRELHRALDGQERFKRRESLDSALDVLQSKGWIRVSKMSTGGRPSETVMLHPKIRESPTPGPKGTKGPKATEPSIQAEVLSVSELPKEKPQGQKPAWWDDDPPTGPEEGTGDEVLAAVSQLDGWL